LDGPAQEILNAGAHAFMQKPFKLAALAAKVKNVLESN
jgi:DNA-binding response OmpR family regulator